MEGLDRYLSPLHIPARCRRLVGTLCAQAPALLPLQLSQLQGLTALHVEGFNLKGAVKGLLHLKSLGTLEVHQAVSEDAWGYERLTALSSLTDCVIQQHAPAIDVSVSGSKVRWCLPCSGCV